MRAITETARDYTDAVRRFSPAARRFLLATFFMWMAHGVSSVLFNLYLVAGGFDAAFVGRAIAFSGFGMAVMAMPAWLLADGWGRRRCLVLGIVVEGAAMLLRALVLAPGPILAASFFAGVGQSLFAIAAAPFITENSTARERTYLFSAFFAVELLAAVLGSVLGGWLPALLAQLPVTARPDLLTAYRITLIVGAGIAFIGAGPLARLRSDAQDVWRPWAFDLVDRASLRLLSPIAVEALLIGAGAGLVIPFMNLYFLERFACSSAQIGSFFGLAQISTAVAMMLGPLIANRFGKLRTATAFQLLSLPFLLTLGGEQRLNVAVGAFLMRATLMQAGTPLIQAFIMESVPPRLRALSTGIANTVWNIGWAVSATLTGYLIPRFGFDKPFYVTAVLYAAAAVYFYVSFRRTPEQPRTEPRLSEEAKGVRGEGPGTE